MRYFLGADLGSTKTHMAVADENGRIVGFARSGPGNHQGVGYDGMLRALQEGLAGAFEQSSLTVSQIAGAGFGIAGYDWPSDEPSMVETIGQLELSCPIGMVNDAVPALFAGAEDSWGVALVSGTGCNCRGLDRSHQREGRVTGFGYHLGEFAGASELVWRAMQHVAFEWTKRGPATAVSNIFIKYAGAQNLPDLIEGYTLGRYRVDAQAAPLIFDVARQGDGVARDLIQWAGLELAEMAKAVIRQLEFEDLTFDVVLAGSMFQGGSLLIEPMWQAITELAPGARLVHLSVPPVLGAVILGMEQAGLRATAEMRRELTDTLTAHAQATTISPPYSS